MEDIAGAMPHGCSANMLDNAFKWVEKLQKELKEAHEKMDAMKLVMENTLKVQSEVFEWRKAWKDKANERGKKLVEQSKLINQLDEQIRDLKMGTKGDK